MATEVFNLRGSNSLGITGGQFTADTSTYLSDSDTLVLYEVPTGKRAKVIVRLHTYGVGNATYPLACKAYAYSYSSGINSKASCSGNLYIGSLNIASPSASVAWSTSTSSAAMNFSYAPSLHVPDYMVGDDTGNNTRAFLSEISTQAGVEIYRPTSYYLAEGEQIYMTYSSTGYAQSTATANIRWNAFFLVYYDFDIIEEDAV